MKSYEIKSSCQAKLQQQIAQINDELREEKLKDHEIQGEDHAKEIDCLLNEIREISQYSSWKLPLGGAVGGGSFGAASTSREVDQGYPDRPI